MPPWMSKICLMPQPALARRSHPSCGQSRSDCREKNHRAVASTSAEYRPFEESYRYSRQGRLNAQVAARALIDDHGMHLFAAPKIASTGQA